MVRAVIEMKFADRQESVLRKLERTATWLAAASVALALVSVVVAVLGYLRAT